MSTAPHPPTACHNCGAVLRGRFCADCGQQNRPFDPTLGGVVGEVAREISDLDGRIVRSVQYLFFSPGFLTTEHFRGRRVVWISPIRLYLVFSVVYFAIVSLTGVSPLNFNLRITGDNDAEARQAVQELGFASEQDMRRTANEALTTWIPRAMFVLIPIFGWLLSRVRRGSGHQYPHHLIFSLHVFAAFFGVQALSTGIGYLAENETVSVLLGIGSVAFAVIYMVVALRTVYGGTVIRALVHTLFVLFFYWLGAIVVTAVIIVPVVFWR